MNRVRWIVLAWFLALGGLGVASSDARALTPCRLATKGDSPIAKACQTGGLEEARKIMRRMRIKFNEGGGEKIECAACHDHADDEHYDTLTKDGRERFKTFLSAIEKK